MISPILANIYLHYILDVWFEKVVKKHISGEATMMAYADDFVCAFRYKRDAERFMKALKKRFNKFGLELAEEKTNLIKFSRFSKDRKGSFNFLGFNYKWIVSRKGKDIINTTTSKKKFNASVQKIKQWIKSNRNQRIRKITDSLNKKLKGYYNYYGVIGNRMMLEKMEKIVMKLLYKWLNRRSQRRSFSWKEFNSKIREFYPLQKIFIENIPKEKQMEMIINA